MARAWCAVGLLVLLAGGAVSMARAQTAEEAFEISQAAQGLVPTSTPEPEPTPEPPRYVPPSRGGRLERWRALVSRYDWDTEQALSVIECESRGDPAAVNPTSGAAGLLQLYGWSGLARRLFGSGDVLVPEINIGVGYSLWRDSGGSFAQHWAASRGCWG